MSFLLLDLALRSALSGTDITRIVSTAPKRYKVYEIPKRGAGTRTIAQPSRELKALQRLVIDTVLSQYPVHSAAMAYEKGRSILKNAQAHLVKPAIMKLDFRDFFHSIKPRDFDLFLERRGTTLERGDVLALHRILFWGKGSYEPVCLSIGAPSSPMMSNILMYDIDTATAELAEGLGLVYTRYADDITVSAATIELLFEFEKRFRKIISNSDYPRLRFNTKKRGIYVRGQRQMVTGLVITPQSSVSIGRERKRLISSMTHRASLGQLNVSELSELKGLLAFASGCEPLFLDRLKRKYGDEIVEEVVRR